MNSFKINRAKWLAGNLTRKFGPGTESMMLDAHGNMCCLGFYAEACGVGKKHLLGKHTPAAAVASRGSIPGRLDFLVNDTANEVVTDFKDCVKSSSLTEEANRLMRLNDDTHISTQLREERLVNAFAKQGIKLSFYGRYPVAK